ncbi:threonine synthase [Actinoplanes sp. TBRC 11911]|uniref:threonine synthase n=1 Tax=Actinoplanes sp. TBRC 11911 TaxID=2729386 RepID=UPI00145EAC75|nr:threonine synthase [Actinoplanes sp. TBRC 11911]NMO55868.1 threonine synthase [Actinoplanes sp. TBRC 11911]
MESALTHLECSRSGERYDADIVQGLSKEAVPLIARYDVERAGRTLTREALATRPPDLWRYREMLPVRDSDHVITLGEGMTPLVPLPRYGARLGLPRLLMKDEGLIPTGSFKARGAAVGVSRAHELGVTGIAMPTNGNAGSAWATYSARAGMKSLIAMPVAAPAITRTECVAVGAELYLVDGLIGDAGRVIASALAARDGYQDVSTLKEPYRIEGKKTMGYEIVEQLGFRVPDAILYPTGGGVGLIGIFKALREMQQLGWIGDKLPKLIAVQAEGCAPIVRAFRSGAEVSEPFPNPHTVAFGITVPKALGDFLVLHAVRATGGTAVAVSDEALLAEQRRLAADEGTFICPEGAACFAAVRQLREGGFLSSADEVVVLNTGAGIKYPETIPVDVPILPPDGSIPA